MMPQQHVGKGSPREALYNRPWNIAKMVLRGANIVSAIIVLSLSLYFLFTSFYSIWITVIFLIPATGCVILWEAAEFITLCARGGRVGIHPGAHVGIHLVLWIYLALGLGFFATFTVYDTLYDNYSYYYYYPDNLPTASAFYAVLAFLAISMLLNFVLFVRACVETHQVNRQARAVYVIPAGQGGQMVPAHPHMSMAYPPQAYMYPAPMPQMQQRESVYNPSAAQQAAEGKAVAGEGVSGGTPLEYYAPTVAHAAR